MRNHAPERTSAAAFTKVSSFDCCVRTLQHTQGEDGCDVDEIVRRLGDDLT